MLTQRRVDQMLDTQTAIAKKVYDSVPIQESWTVTEIIRSIKDLNGGNTPDHRIISGCINNLTDSGLIKRIGRDRYKRADIRQQKPGSSQVDDLEIEEVAALALPTVEQAVAVVQETVETISHEVAAMSNTNVSPIKSTEVKPIIAKVGGPEKVDALTVMVGLAEQLVNMSNGIKSIAQTMEDLALQIESERDVFNKKADEMAQLRKLLRSTLGDD